MLRQVRRFARHVAAGRSGPEPISTVIRIRARQCSGTGYLGYKIEKVEFNLCECINFCSAHLTIPDNLNKLM
jgi:hypothetical protein